MVQSRKVTARAYASTSNLGFGFDVFGLCLDSAYDEVAVCAGSNDIDVSICGHYADGIPTDPEANTASLAVAALMRATGRDEPLSIEIRKGIRSGSGTGSSAASAAAAVVAADAYLGTRLSRGELTRFAGEGERASAGSVHYDNVGASVFGGLVACIPCEEMSFSSIDVSKKLRFVVTLPEIIVRTADSRAVLPTEISMADYIRGAARCVGIVEAVREGDGEQLGAMIENSFVDQARSSLIRGFDDVRAAAKEAGAFGVSISGAGPSVLAIASDSLDCAGIGRAMESAFAIHGIDSKATVSEAGAGASVLE